MDIKNKLNQIHEGSVSQCFCTDSIRHCSLEHLMKVGLFLCNFFFIGVRTSCKNLVNKHMKKEYNFLKKTP